MIQFLGKRFLTIIIVVFAFLAFIVPGCIVVVINTLATNKSANFVNAVMGFFFIAVGLAFSIPIYLVWKWKKPKKESWHFWDE